MQSVSFGISANMIFQTIWMFGPWTNKMDYIFMLYFLFFFRHRKNEILFQDYVQFFYRIKQTKVERKNKGFFVNTGFILFEYHLNCLWTIKVI